MMTGLVGTALLTGVAMVAWLIGFRAGQRAVAQVVSHTMQRTADQLREQGRPDAAEAAEAILRGHTRFVRETLGLGE